MAKLATKSCEPGKPGKQQIELFLHPKRPGVGEGIQISREGKIIRGLVVQRKVGQSEQGPDPGIESLARLRVHSHREQGCDRDAQHQCRHEPPHAATIEIKQEVNSSWSRAPLQRSGDHIARNHKKNIYTEIPRRQDPTINVIDDHGQDGECPQPINLRPIVMARGRGLPRWCRHQNQQNRGMGTEKGDASDEPPLDGCECG